LLLSGKRILDNFRILSFVKKAKNLVSIYKIQDNDGEIIPDLVIKGEDLIIKEWERRDRRKRLLDKINIALEKKEKS
jgi:hypothetical protein